jgi:hypothetical protein
MTTELNPVDKWKSALPDLGMTSVGVIHEGISSRGVPLAKLVPIEGITSRRQRVIDRLVLVHAIVSFFYLFG